MEKLKLSTSAFQKGEVLTRSQLKKVLGGELSGSGGLCTDWANKEPDICYNCCVTLHPADIETCDEYCGL